MQKPVVYRPAGPDLPNHIIRPYHLAGIGCLNPIFANVALISEYKERLLLPANCQWLIDRVVWSGRSGQLRW